MSAVKIDLINAFSLLPPQLPSSLCVKENALVERSFLDRILCAIIPSYATKQDVQVAHYFLNFFKELIAEKQNSSPDRIQSIIALAEEYIHQRLGPRTVKPSQEIGSLERYTLAARIRCDLFDPEHTRADLQHICKEHNKELFLKWEKLRFEAVPQDKEVFWMQPDLVDFIFKTHLHRHIRHQDYQHHIELEPVVKKKRGIWVFEREPHLLMNGVKTPWSHIRSLISSDKDERFCSYDAQGNKQYWIYLDEGLVPHNRYDFDKPRRFKKLQSAPRQCEVQIVTTHAPKNKWNWTDRLLKGTRHTFLRVIFREGFERDHPDLPFKGGEVYSIGWGAEKSRDFSMCSPLASLKAQYFGPDSFEFFAEDLYETTKSTADEKVIKLMETVKKQAKENRTFHPNIENCTTSAMQLLKESEIADFEVRDHMAYMWYKFFLPKGTRRYLDKIGRAYKDYVPNVIQWPVKHSGGFLFACLFIPIFSVLGAWKKNIHYAQEVPSTTSVHPHFGSIRDLFDSNKMSYDLTMKVYKWQKNQAKLNPACCRFVKQT